MENQSQLPISKIQVLRAISDSISSVIFNEVVKKPRTSEELMRILDITPKQYYTRQTGLITAGLVGRRSQILTLTSFGKIVSKAQEKVARAGEHLWQLKIIDELSSKSGMPENERKEFIDKLIKDQEIKRFIPHYRN
jgi:DNA-binding HxlR family transcriptional regulator